MWLPGRRDPGTSNEVVDYNKSMGLLAEFHQTIIMRISKSSAEEAKQLANQRYDKTRERVNQMSFMDHGVLGHKLPEDVTMKH